MKAFRFIALWFVGSALAFATAQVSEPLQIGQIVHRIHGSVLSRSMVEHFQAYVREHGFQFDSTANYKGYRIDLAVVDERLVIRNIRFEVYPNAKTEDIIGTSVPKEGMHADWFSGELIEYFGEHFLAHSRSDERVFLFEKGRLVRVFERKNKWWEDAERRAKKKE